MKDGGFAFPRPLPPDAIITPEVLARYGGMSLRQWYAGQVLAGLLANPNRTGTFAQYANESYAIADEMIEAGEE